MIGLFLTKDQILELTGYRRPSNQIRWLRDQGFKFKVAADGKPRVLVAEVNHLMCSDDGITREIKRQKPDYEALNRNG